MMPIYCKIFLNELRDIIVIGGGSILFMLWPMIPLLFFPNGYLAAICGFVVMFITFPATLAWISKRALEHRE